ncbi:hypothetical protein OF83DRAFT_1083280 [Amylostereum chailletii]|nr:hypothetical protein OF83DRAFT_1083280 [Amylostereum chailletii]
MAMLSLDFPTVALLGGRAQRRDAHSRAPFFRLSLVRGPSPFIFLASRGRFRAYAAEAGSQGPGHRILFMVTLSFGFLGGAGTPLREVVRSSLGAGGSSFFSLTARASHYLVACTSREGFFGVGSSS